MSRGVENERANPFIGDVAKSVVLSERQRQKGTVPQELLKKHIEEPTNGYRDNPAEARLSESGIRVRAIIGSLSAYGTGSLSEVVEETAENYDIPSEAVQAAVTYYSEHMHPIDRRIDEDMYGRRDSTVDEQPHPSLIDHTTGTIHGSENDRIVMVGRFALLVKAMVPLKDSTIIPGKRGSVILGDNLIDRPQKPKGIGQTIAHGVRGLAGTIKRAFHDN